MNASILLTMSAACLVLVGCRTSTPPAPEEPSAAMEATQDPGRDASALQSGAEAAAQGQRQVAAEAASAAVPMETRIEHVDAGQAKALVDRHEQVVILDVRTPREYQAGHIPGALNFDYNSGDFAKNLAKLDKTTPYLVHCASGGRSTRSLELFKQQGFQMIYHLDGGFNGWKQTGNPVVPSASQK